MIALLLIVVGLIASGVVGGITGRRMRGSKRMVWVDIVPGILGALAGGGLALGNNVQKEPSPLIGWVLIVIASVIGAVTLTVVVNWVIRKIALRNPTSPVHSADVPFPEHRASPIDRPAPSQSAGGDIFISYASPDRPTAEALAKALMKEGWSVWWDRTIPPGKSFDEVIEAALSTAKCVIVLWSRASGASDWVKVEASDAAKRRILIPALIEEVTIPLEFRRIQSASLVDWRGASPHPGFDALVGSVAGIVGKPRTSSATSI